MIIMNPWAWDDYKYSGYSWGFFVSGRNDGQDNYDDNEAWDARDHYQSRGESVLFVFD